MKVKSLYIGRIVEIDKIVLEEYGPVCYYKKLRGAILYKPFNHSNYVKDLLLGSKYEVGMPKNPSVGVHFVPKLESGEVVKDLYLNDYEKNHISERKLRKLILSHDKRRILGGNV